MKNQQALKQVAHGAGIIFFGTFFAYFISFLYRLIISRYLGPSDYGLIALGLMVLNVATMLAFLGLNEGILRFAAFYKGENKLSKVKGTLVSSLAISLPVSIALAAIIILLARPISVGLFKSEALIPVLIIFAAIIPLNVILRAITTFFLALKKAFYSELLRSFFRDFVNLVLVVIVVVIGGTVLDVSWTFLIAAAVSAFLCFVFLERKVFPLFRSKIKAAYNYTELLNFSIPLLFTGIFINIMGWADTFFLGFYKTEADVGIYNVALPLAAGMGMFLFAFSLIFYPVLAQAMGRKKSKEDMAHVFSVVLRWIFMLSFPIFVIGILFPKEIIGLLYGQEYIAGAIPLVILLIGYFINVVTGPTVETLKAYEKTKFIFNINLFVVILNIILNIILIPKYGMIGAAVATTISLAIREIVIWVKARSLIHFTYNAKYYAKYILCTAIPLAIIYFVLSSFFRPYTLWTLIIAVILFFVSYICLLLLFRCFSQDDFMVLKAIEHRAGLKLGLIEKVMKRFS